VPVKVSYLEVRIGQTAGELLPRVTRNRRDRYHEVAALDLKDCLLPQDLSVDQQNGAKSYRDVF
jgi:hypothetical protein